MKTILLPSAAHLGLVAPLRVIRRCRLPSDRIRYSCSPVARRALVKTIRPLRPGNAAGPAPADPAIAAVATTPTAEHKPRHSSTRVRVTGLRLLLEPMGNQSDERRASLRPPDRVAGGSGTPPV